MRKRVDRGISKLVPKNHFMSLRIFREEPLVSWRYTDSVLFTAFDVFRTNDFWIENVLNSKMSIREALHEEGFPRNVSIMVDTGIFEIEARKAGIAQKLGIEIDFNLTLEQILWVYKLADADFYVVPDEIILATDNTPTVESKVSMMMENTRLLIEEVPASKLVAVLQGNKASTIDHLFNFYREQGITKFAAGGIIPLWKHDRQLCQKMIMYMRKITKSFHLHIFGLPSVKLLPLYIQGYQVDSVDTSVLLYLSARRRYLKGTDVREIRCVDFTECDCAGCKGLSPKMNPRSVPFFVNLYIHNVLEAQRVAESGFVLPIDELEKKEDEKYQKEQNKKQVEIANPIWRTAAEGI